ncbi:MAG: dephospho-CoA kinase [Thiobacillaceae bacterium]
MRVVGLTGGIGSGKSTVAELFAQLGVPVIDTDHLARELTCSGGQAMPLIRTQFGPDYLNPDGGLNRPLMRRTVFGDAASRARLEAILHPLIRKQVETQLNSLAVPYALVVIPLLVEKGGYTDLLDQVLVVDCNPAQQIARTMARSELSREEVELILAAQADRQARLERADDVIVNDGDCAELGTKIQALHEKYSSLANKKP